METLPKPVKFIAFITMGLAELGGGGDWMIRSYIKDIEDKGTWYMIVN